MIDTTVLPAIVTTQTAEHTLARPDLNPAVVYLSSLAQGSRRAQRSALDTVASMFSGGRLNHETLPWTGVHYQHVRALRSVLVESGRATATTNRILAAVRCVVRESWRLGLISANELAKINDVDGVKGSRLEWSRSVRGRNLE